jgi:hypothetical protein
MIREFLNYKYGHFVTNELLTAKHEVIWDNMNKDGYTEQAEVKSHLRKLCDAEGNRLVPDEFLTVDWGMDFSSWIGEFTGGKDYFFIGAEPHITSNYQLVYDFGNRKGRDLDEVALGYADNKNDIWHYIVNNFVANPTVDSKIGFLKRCYITDLCHLVPKGCGQVDDIAKKLNITRKRWEEFRRKIARSFLRNEIETAKPKFIVLHGAASRNFFSYEFGVEFKGKVIDGWTHCVFEGELEGRRIIAVPHLKGQMLNELWRSKRHPERRESVRAIIQEFLASGA